MPSNTYTTPVGTFVQYRVEAVNRDGAVREAKRCARSANLKVLDIAQVTLQPHLDWVVELQVREVP